MYMKCFANEKKQQQPNSSHFTVCLLFCCIAFLFRLRTVCYYSPMNDKCSWLSFNRFDYSYICSECERLRENLSNTRRQERDRANQKKTETAVHWNLEPLRAILPTMQSVFFITTFFPSLTVPHVRMQLTMTK